MENYKDDCFNGVIVDMSACISEENLSILKQVLVKNFYGVSITKEVTALSTETNINERFIQKFCMAIRSRNLSVGTIRQYKRAIDNLIKFLGNKNIKDINNDDIEYYFAVCLSKRNLSDSYVNTLRMYLSAFFNYATDHDYIAKNPMRQIKAIKCEQKKKEVLSDKEIVIVRDACNTTKELALIDMLLSTGIRVSEICGLNISHVDFDSKTVQVYGKKTRTWRTVYLDSRALMHLQDYIETRVDNLDALFLSKRKTRCQPTTIQNMIKKIVNRTKIKKKCTVHTFRRTFASILFRRGMDLPYVSKLLGHKDCKVTEKHYLSIVQDDIKNNFMRLSA